MNFAMFKSLLIFSVLHGHSPQNAAILLFFVVEEKEVNIIYLYIAILSDLSITFE